MASHKKQPGKTRKRRNAAQKTPREQRLTAGQWFEKLVALQERLRAPNGCPWDREQTHATLRTYLIEEAYEVLDALESGDDAKFAEELGDLLLQIIFHSDIAREAGRFDVTDVIREIHEKMVRRHPHVFGEKRAKDAAEVLKNWEHIKAEERRTAKKASSGGEKKPPSILDGINAALPATLEGFQLTRKASRIGFDWENSDGVIAKLQEETAELRQAIETKESVRIEEEMGDLLFAAVNLSRIVGIDPEIALKKANRKFSRRFREMERAATVSGRTFTSLEREEMERHWEQAKETEAQELEKGSAPKPRRPAKNAS